MTSDASASKRKMRWWVPIALLALVSGLVGYFFLTEEASRQFYAIALVLILIPVLLLWYIWLTQLPWGRRFMLFGLWVAMLGLVVGGLAMTTRWEGSLSGGAVPRLVWRWAKKPDQKLARLEGSGSEAKLKGAAVVSEFRQFLGPHRDGILPQQLEPDWVAHPPRELWRRKIGAGWSGFSVAEGRAITQEQRGKKELVSCYDLLTGDPLWVLEEEVRFVEKMGGDGPRANPTIFENRVYALGGTGILNCIDLSSGQRIWGRQILKEHGATNLMYGKACSPLIVGELVVVTGGKSPGPTLLAYHREKGELVWSAGEDSASYASPVLGTLAGQEQIVCVNHNTVTGHGVGTGKILWTWKWKANRPKSAQAQLVGQNQVFVSASYGMGTALLEISKKGEAFAVKKIWKGKAMKTKFSNVSIVAGHAYGLSEGKLSCVKVATGKTVWTGDYYGYGQNIVVGDHVLIQAEDGHVALAEVSPEAFRAVAEMEALRYKTWNAPTLAGAYLLVRNDREAACFKLKLK